MNEILTPEKIKEKFKEKMVSIKNRLDFLIDSLDIDNNIECFTNIYENIKCIEDDICKLENRLNMDNINNIVDEEERNRIINQKILKLFSPFILYYKLSLLQNS